MPSSGTYMTTDFKESFDAVDQTDHRAKHELHLNLGLIKFVQLLRKIAKMALLNPCIKFKKNFGQKTTFEAL